MQRHCDRQETQSGDEVVVVTTWRTAAKVRERRGRVERES